MLNIVCRNQYQPWRGLTDNSRSCRLILMPALDGFKMGVLNGHDINVRPLVPLTNIGGVRQKQILFVTDFQRRILRRHDFESAANVEFHEATIFKHLNVRLRHREVKPIYLLTYHDCLLHINYSDLTTSLLRTVQRLFDIGRSACCWL